MKKINRRSRANPMDLGAIVSSAAEWEKRKRRQIEVFCGSLAGFMSELHGGDYRIQVEHDAGLIVIARRLHESAKPIRPSDLREAV